MLIYHEKLINLVIYDFFKNKGENPIYLRPVAETCSCYKILLARFPALYG